MPLYKDGRFFCTVAVSRSGRVLLVSQVPSDWNGWLTDGDDLDDCGWSGPGIPSTPGLHECLVQVRFELGEPVVSVLNSTPTTQVTNAVYVPME
jgi:hypothetical protein